MPWPDMNGIEMASDGDGTVPTRPYSVRKSVMKDMAFAVTTGITDNDVCTSKQPSKNDDPDDTIQWYSGTTEDGTIPAHEGDGVKIYPNPARENSGGTVQDQSTNALNTYEGCGSGVVVRDKSQEIELNEGDVASVSTPGRSTKDQNGSRFKNDDTAFTVTATDPNGIAQNQLGQLRIRYLTPRECLRLMGQSEDAIDRLMSAVPQKSWQYKLAGNSIVVDVLMAIFKGIYTDNTFNAPRPRQQSLDGWGKTD